eukprot:5518420-Prorocentrum_lima.AAC.1
MCWQWPIDVAGELHVLKQLPGGHICPLEEPARLVGDALAMALHVRNPMQQPVGNDEVVCK